MFDKFCEGFFKFFNRFGELILFIAGSLIFTCSMTSLFSSLFHTTFFSAFIKVHIFYAVAAITIAVILFISYIYDKGEEITQNKQQETINAIKDNKYEEENTKYIMNEILVTLENSEKCRVRIEIPQEISTQNSSDTERKYIENWLRTNMQNIREWSK